MTSGERLSSDIFDKLRHLRSALRRRLASEALAWLSIALVCAVFVTLAFDYVLHMERPLRILMMVLAAAALAWVLWRRLVAPLAVPMPDEELALLIERRHPELGDRLISAIQFTRRGAGATVESPAMIRQVVDEAQRMARPLDVDAIVEHRTARATMRIAACALCLLAGFTIWQGQIMSKWLARNVMFAAVDWPQDTYLRVEGDDFTLLRGDDLTVVISVDERSTVAPPHVIIHARYPTVGWTQERIDATGPERRRYEKVFQAVAEEFSFYVTGGDDRRDKRRPHRVRLIDPPGLSKLNFVVIHAAYMNLPDLTLSGSRGVLAVPAGSEVLVFAESTKDLQSAKIMLDGREVADAHGDAAGAREVVGRFRVDVPPSPAGKSAAAVRILQFALTDSDGYSNRGGQKYTIEVQVDQSPSVDLRKRAVRALIAPEAIVPLVLRAEDDYGISAARALLRAKGRELGVLPQPIAVEPGGTAKLAVRHEFDLKGCDLKPGDVIAISAAVDDSLPPGLGGPNTAASGAITLRVVEPEEVMAELVRRQKALRLEFVQAMSLQAEVRDMTAAAVAELAGGKITPEVTRRLNGSARTQAAVATECAKSAESFRAIRQEMIYNRLGEKDEHEQLLAIVDSLHALVAPAGEVVAALNATESVRDAAAAAEQAGAVARTQQELCQRMDRILAMMHELATRQDMINTLRQILRWSEKQLKNIEKRATAEGGGVFDPAEDDKTPPG